jgi:hypothetical protein
MSQESRRCPYCGNRISLLGSRIIERAVSAEDARMILLKEKERLFRSRKKDSSSQFRVDYADEKDYSSN